MRNKNSHMYSTASICKNKHPSAEKCIRIFLRDLIFPWYCILLIIYCANLSYVIGGIYMVYYILMAQTTLWTTMTACSMLLKHCRICLLLGYFLYVYFIFIRKICECRQAESRKTRSHRNSGKFFIKLTTRIRVKWLQIKVCFV